MIRATGCLFMEPECVGSDAYKRRRGEHFFSKSPSQDETVYLYRELPTDVSVFLEELIGLVPEELPVFAYFRNKQDWLVGTTRAVIFLKEGRVFRCVYSNVKGWGFSFGPSYLDREKPWKVDQSFTDDKGEKHYSKLTGWFFICGSDCVRHELFIDNDLHRVWNILEKLREFDKKYPPNA